VAVVLIRQTTLESIKTNNNDFIFLSQQNITFTLTFGCNIGQITISCTALSSQYHWNQPKKHNHTTQTFLQIQVQQFDPMQLARFSSKSNILFVIFKNDDANKQKNLV
jgi:hypothetical protein